jgi:hypothetical protein
MLAFEVTFVKAHTLIPPCLRIRRKIDFSGSIERFTLLVVCPSLFSSYSIAVKQERINLARTLHQKA